MNPNLIPDIFAISLFIVTLFISLRAFQVYSQTHAIRLFTLGLSMAVIALTAADNLVANFITIPFNTYWFLYLGQTISYFFIFLSLINSSDTYLQKLVRWHILVSVLVVGLLLLASPLLPAFPNVGVRAIVSGSRVLPCFGIFFCYASAFMTKETRFSLLMSTTFMLLTFGSLAVVDKYFVSNSAPLDNFGDISRLVALVILLIAILGG